MKRNLLTFGILAVAMLLPCVASAKNIEGYTTVDGWDYTVYDDGTAELTKAPGATGAVVIPETITYEGNTYTVTRLGFSLFDSNVNITAIQLPSGLKEIGGACLSLVYESGNSHRRSRGVGEYRSIQPCRHKMEG